MFPEAGLSQLRYKLFSPEPKRFCGKQVSQSTSTHKTRIDCILFSISSENIELLLLNRHTPTDMDDAHMHLQIHYLNTNDLNL